MAAPLEITDEKLDKIRKQFFITPLKIRNRIQCFASKFALNRCFEDMHEIARQGIFAVTLEGHGSPFSSDDSFYWNFNIGVTSRELMREIRRKDYSLSDYHYSAHLFFEIPIINEFSDEQLEKWQEFCLKTLARQVFFNKKKAKQWLKMKKMNEDFED